MASVSHVVKSTLSMPPTATPSTAIFRYGGISRRMRHQQQARNFRFSLWSSYLDPVFQKELQRRHRVIKHKYAEALNRNLCWDRRRPPNASQWGLKGLTRSSWHARDTRPGGRWVNMDELVDVKESPEALDNRGIEEVEQTAVDKLFGHHNAHWVMWSENLSTWTKGGKDSTPSEIVRTRKEKVVEGESTDYSRPRQSNGVPETSPISVTEEEYDIDPISNRKVLRKMKPPSEKVRPEVTEIPVKTFKGYRSRFSQFEPPIERDSAKIIHLDGQHSSSTRQPMPQLDPGLQDEIDNCKPFRYNEPDGKIPEKMDPGTQFLKEFDHPYYAFKYSPLSTSESLSEFMNQCKPFKYNEPDGNFPESRESVSESLSDYDRQCKSFKYNEPGGQLSATADPVEESLNEYDRRSAESSFKEDEAVTPFETDMKSLKPTGNSESKDTTEPEKRWLSQEGFSAEPVLSQETADSEALGKVDRKGGSASQRITYQQKSNFIAANDEKEDLDLLRASDVRAASGILKRPRKETQAEKDSRRAALEAEYNESQLPSKSCAGDIVAGKESKGIRQPAAAFERERSYLLDLTARDRGEIKARTTELEKTSDKTANLLKRIKDAKEHLEERTAQLAELEESGMPPNHLDVEQLHPTGSNNLTGNFVRDFPEEFNVSWKMKASSASDCLVRETDTDAWGYDKSPKGLELSYQQEVENNAQSPENGQAPDAIAANAYVRGSTSARLETALHRNLRAAEHARSLEADPYAKVPQGLETSYSEELEREGACSSPLFVSSYGCESSGSNSTRPDDVDSGSPQQIIREDKKTQDNQLVKEIQGIYESAYGKIDSEHRQPSAGEQSVADTSKENYNDAREANIQKLEQEVREGQYNFRERYMDVAKVVAKQVPDGYQNEAAGTKTDSDISAVRRASTSPLEPTLYKILAYDPIMQVINTAETTSLVVDSSSALTPAEVLLRLSNPAKFFPHFQPLQAQGYEIAAGSGDVLVFRKVREEVPLADVKPSTSSTSTPAPRMRKDVNPIDGMQSFPQPATGNYANPTGFVNHDLPPEDRFISGIDVRREEPVFSGRKTEWRDSDSMEGLERRPRKLRGRGLLVGAAWLAACSYAVGVVAEYFKTGGSDGTGPVGF